MSSVNWQPRKWVDSIYPQHRS